MPLTRLKSMDFVKNIQFDVCAMTEMVKSYENIEIKSHKIKNDLSEYDYVIIPGDHGVKDLSEDFFFWMKTMSLKKKAVALCGGVFVLAILGRLKGLSATTICNLLVWNSLWAICFI